MERLRRYAERIKVILLLDEGETYKNISKFLFLDEGTIANYRKRYKKGGIEGLVNDDYSGRKTMLTDEDLKILDSDLRKCIFPTTAVVIAHVGKKFGVQYSRGGMTELLHRLGFSFKKPKGVPGKAKKEAQKKFVEEYDKRKSEGGLTYFGDATHPTFNTALTHGWIKKGTDFEVKTNSGRKHLNINGVIEINTMEVITRSSERINAGSTCTLMREIRRKHPEEKNITLILDNAGYNKAKKVFLLAKNLGIKIIFLPPYSPNLNPIERLWKFMRKKALANKYYDNFSDWRNAVMGFFRGIRKYRSELETLITDNFHLMGT